MTRLRAGLAGGSAGFSRQLAALGKAPRQVEGETAGALLPDLPGAK